MSLYKHIIYIPFSGVGLFDDPDDDAWLLYRIGVFKNFTLKSILNQSIKPDLLWLSFDGRRNNGWIKALVNSIPIPTIVTYSGLIYKDDKYIIRLRGSENYQSTGAQAVRMIGRAVKRRSLKIFIRYIWRLLFKNLTLESRLSALQSVKNALGTFQWVYLTRIDSDDLIHRDWIKECNMYKPQQRRCLTRDKGYVYNGETLAEWNPITHPQFFTLCIPRRAFEPKAWIDYWNGYISHEDADRVFTPTRLRDYRYLMIMHGNQISSTWNHPFRDKEIKDLTKLIEFGL
jgi:hypothetical protein